MLDDLIVWTKEHFGALFAVPDDDFEQKFDATYSKTLEISVNGSKFTREQVKLTVLAMRATSVSTQCDFREMRKELKVSDGPLEVR